MGININDLGYIKQDYLKIKAANSILKSRIDKALLNSLSEDEKNISTGSCRLCKPCKRKNNEKCAHPSEMTYSFEALGIDVSRMVNDIFGLTLLWYSKGNPPQYTCVVAGLLSNKKDSYLRIENEISKL